MNDWEAHVLQFWENVHRRGTNVHLGNTHAHDYPRYFSQAGTFAQDAAKAKAVLDVGPGFGRWLDATVGKDRYAIDVSEISLERVRGMGVRAFLPGKIGAGVVDLAACLSVVQHCDEAAVRVILSDVSRALRSGGSFYLNGVHGGHHTPTPEGKLSGGRFSYTPARMRELAAEHGFTVEGDHVYRVGALEVWIFCWGKP